MRASLVESCEVLEGISGVVVVGQARVLVLLDAVRLHAMVHLVPLTRTPQQRSQEENKKKKIKRNKTDKEKPRREIERKRLN